MKDESKQRTYKSRFNSVMKQDEYSTTRPTLKRWSNGSPAVEPRRARPTLHPYKPYILIVHYLPTPPTYLPRVLYFMPHTIYSIMPASIVANQLSIKAFIIGHFNFEVDLVIQRFVQSHSMIPVVNIRALLIEALLF